MVKRDRPQMTIKMAHALFVLDNRLESDTQNMKYLLIFYGNSGYANAPLCCAYTYISCILLILFFTWTNVKAQSVNDSKGRFLTS